MVIGHPLLEVSNHSILGLVIQGDMKRIDPVDLGPASAACILQGRINIYKGLVDLLRDGVWLAPFFVKIPACFAISVKECREWMQMELTLTGTVDKVSSANGGGVPVALQIVGAKSFVGVLLHRHSDGL